MDEEAIVTENQRRGSMVNTLNHRGGAPNEFVGSQVFGKAGSEQGLFCSSVCLCYTSDVLPTEIPDASESCNAASPFHTKFAMPLNAVINITWMIIMGVFKDDSVKHEKHSRDKNRWRRHGGL